jgi:perosamine synthetase
MKNNIISLHEPVFDEDDERLVLESIRSSWVSTGGKFVDKFEKDFADFVGAKYAISVCNGTIGLQLVLECLKRKRNFESNFEVIVPSLTFIATTNSIYHSSGHPVFVDVDKNSFQISNEEIRNLIKNIYVYNAERNVWYNKITKRYLLAIMPVHIMGWSASMEKLNALSKEFSIPVIEDAAEALGVYDLNNSHIGKDSLASVFSFNGNKILTTGGGGMIVTNDDSFANYLKHISTTGKIDNLRFVHDEVAYNFRLVNILSALGCSQLNKIREKLIRKKEIFNLYAKRLNSEGLEIYSQDNCISNNWLINIIFKKSKQRELVLHELIANNIQVRPLWTPCHLQPAYNNKDLYISKFLKNTEDIWQRTLSLPSSSHLSDEKILNIADKINIVLNRENRY